MTAAAALLILTLARAIVRDRDAAGVLALLVILGVAVGGRPVTWLVVCPAIAFIAWQRRRRRIRIEWSVVGRVMSASTTVLGLVVLLEVIQLGRVGDLVATLQRETPLRPQPVAPPLATAPDVFVILLDGYARHDVLVDRFDLDDGPLLDGLRIRGFAVSPESHSNYPSTNPSLASFLNHQQLVDMPSFAELLANPSAVEGPTAYRAISGAAVLEDFRAVGYQSIAIASGFNQASLRGADRFIDTGEISEFEIAALRSSVVVPVATALDPDVFSRSHRDRIANTFAAVASIAGTRSDRPRFVFAHVASPHAPWVNNTSGGPRVVSDLDTWFFDSPAALGLTRRQVVEAFAGQTAHLGTRVLATVDRILADDPREAVIVVLSDHGAALDAGWDEREIRLRNLFAAYTPGKPGLFPPYVTPVNVFPTLFEAYLEVIILRTDETLYAAGLQGSYDFVPIDPAGAR